MHVYLFSWKVGNCIRLRGNWWWISLRSDTNKVICSPIYFCTCSVCVSSRERSQLVKCVYLPQEFMCLRTFLYPTGATGTGDLFEGDILLELGEEPYGGMQQTRSRIRRDDVMTSSGQEAQTMESDPDYTHIWPNNTVYYTFAQTLGKCILGYSIVAQVCT